MFAFTSRTVRACTSEKKKNKRKNVVFEWISERGYRSIKTAADVEREKKKTIILRLNSDECVQSSFAVLRNARKRNYYNTVVSTHFSIRVQPGPYFLRTIFNVRNARVGEVLVKWHSDRVRTPQPAMITPRIL